VDELDLVVGGVTAVVPEDAIDDIAALPGVAAVYEDELLQLDTDASPEFIGAPSLWNQLGGDDAPVRASSSASSTPASGPSIRRSPTRPPPATPSRTPSRRAVPVRVR
jgi:hypothetical protein